MAGSEKAKGLLSLLKDGANPDTKLIYKQTLGFLEEQGFEEPDFTNFKNKTDKLYTLSDPHGQNHIGKSYAFLLRSDISDYKFAINKEEGWEGIAYRLLAADEINDHETFDEGKIKVYSGLDAVSALVKIMDIRNSIAKAEAEGCYETAEHFTSNIDLDGSED